MQKMSSNSLKKKPASIPVSNQHVVVVWEIYENNSWIPYSPNISQNLERAFFKKLTRVNLTDCEGGGDSDGRDSGLLYVNMRTMKQCSDNLMFQSLNVRRQFYKCVCPGGKGIKWEWNDAGLWRTYNMEVQQVIEETWTKGNEKVELHKTYLRLQFTINFLTLTQISDGGRTVKSVRRIQQAPYPKLSIKNEAVAKSLEMLEISSRQSFHTNTNPRPKQIIPGNQTNIINHKPNSKREKSSHEHSGPSNIARQILNFVSKTSVTKFGNHKTPSEHQPRSRVRQKHSQDTDSSSVKSNRRPSVDTVSTYLTNFSRESQDGREYTTGSVHDLLDCSIEDDVFGPSSISSTVSSQKQGQIVGIDNASNYLARFVRVVDTSEPVSGPCPYCLEELRLKGQYPTVQLVRCNHLLHLNCLNELIINGQQCGKQKNLFIECPICMTIYGKKIGNQPYGTMTWFKDSGGNIQIVYNFTSGVQDTDHPNPGCKYFAVGFPRKQLLPDTPEGRKVLKYLKIAFDRRLLFSIGCSATTGVEDVIQCNKVDIKSYQDPNYLQRCMQQLLYLGVTD
uniref:E3 ubiquitin-protein ligase n=1 Tax=Culicoides sonorensis TaxID=179676 RepID=A0A336M6U9_CULSO